MKKQLFFNIHLPTRNAGDYRAFAEEYGIKVAFDSDEFIVFDGIKPVIEGSAEHQRLIDLLSKHGVALPIMGDAPVFEDEDFEAAPFIELSVVAYEKSVLKTKFPGTLMYRGNPCQFAGWDLLSKTKMMPKSLPPAVQVGSQLTLDAQVLGEFTSAFDREIGIIFLQKQASLLVSDKVRQAWEQSGIQDLTYWPCEWKKFIGAPAADAQCPWWGMSIHHVIKGPAYLNRDLKSNRSQIELRPSDIAEMPDIAVLNEPYESGFHLFAKPVAWRAAKHLMLETCIPGAAYRELPLAKLFGKTTN